MISYNVAPFTAKVFEYMQDAVNNKKICGDGKYTKLCNRWFEVRTGSPKVMLTTSCSHSLEMAAILLGIQPGDEVIIPSFTFVSTANAFVLRGAKIIYVDIRPDTMNMDEKLIEDSITDKTKAIVPVHYAGVSCEMDTIISIARRHNLAVVEDAAQGVMSEYKERSLGSIGDIGCFSFHETKNYSMGEGGAILLNQENNSKTLIERAEIIREKGTNRSKFYRGEIDKYTWMDMGSSYLPSDILAAYLWAQLEIADEIYDRRMTLWNRYYDELKPLLDRGILELPIIPPECKHNAHIFYIKTRNLDERTRFINYMKDNDILAVFHYIPLHQSPAGKRFGEFRGEDKYTTKESERLVRLPLYYDLDDNTQDYIINTIKRFYGM
ncbi:dTDP-4-amino-4,6-dideoxygalactose transaminase [Lachnospiraceae bacterium NE2001]|nr:dTDP-4-amino-4,6-dideoxygalactose transaminase [Lachnospiraceae bacterium NE2001]